jgi:hypothetical protein
MLVKLTSGGYINWMADVLTPLCNFLRAHLNYSEKNVKTCLFSGVSFRKKISTVNTLTFILGKDMHLKQKLIISVPFVI